MIFCVKADFPCQKINDINDYHLRNIIVSHKQIQMKFWLKYKHFIF